MKDELREMFDEQKDFQRYFYNPDKLSRDEKIRYTKENVLAVHQELGEILDTLPWKTHRDESKPFIQSNTIEEIIDTFKFLLNLCVVWNIDKSSFVSEFHRKSKVVRQRYSQEILNKISSEDKVCAIDLDDVLADSSQHFTQVYNKKHSAQYSNRSTIKKELDTLSYEEFKHYFRTSGEKINIPAKEGAKEFCDYLHDKGYKIVIITARPHEKYNRIFPDTLEWLHNNNIKYDAVFFDKEKHVTILKRFPQCEFIVEDNVHYAQEVSDLNYKVFLLMNYFDNIAKPDLQDNLIVVDTFEEIKKRLEEYVEKRV